MARFFDTRWSVFTHGEQFWVIFFDLSCAESSPNLQGGCCRCNCTCFALIAIRFKRLASAHLERFMWAQELGPHSPMWCSCRPRRCSHTNVGMIVVTCVCLGARFVQQCPRALGALGGSFEYGWMRVLGREGNNSQRCMSPALVSITAVAGDVSRRVTPSPG